MPSREHSPGSTLPLHDLLRARRTAALLADAELIRDAPPSTEREDEARRAVREAMLLFSLRRISLAERDRILDILSFAAVREPVPEPADPDPGFDLDSPDAHGPIA